jgi:hypothetical protein
MEDRGNVINTQQMLMDMKNGGSASTAEISLLNVGGGSLVVSLNFWGLRCWTFILQNKLKIKHSVWNQQNFVIHYAFSTHFHLSTILYLAFLWTCITRHFYDGIEVMLMLLCNKIYFLEMLLDNSLLHY